MTKILPYNEEITKPYVFLKPSGKILTIDGISHESFAYLYTTNLCLELHKRLMKLEFDHPNEMLSYFHQSFDEENPDMSSAINSIAYEYNLFKLWKNSPDFNGKYIDFLIYILGFDLFKTMESTNFKEIITTEDFPHIKYFNYYLMEWSIKNYKRKVYDQATNSFIDLEKQEHSLDIECEYLEEIQEIKRKVLLKDRSKYFK